MPATYTLIASNTLSSNTISVTFSAIPATFTDLVLRISNRSTASGLINGLTRITFNGTATNYSDTSLNAGGTTVGSFRNTNNTYFDPLVGAGDSSGNTSNTFNSIEIYIPSYGATQNKAISAVGFAEDNSAGNNNMNAQAVLWRNTAAISSITITEVGANNFASGSSFFLYGIKNS
jgi:hypothetical protein